MFSTAEADMRRERERKDQENKKNQKVEFIAGGVQAGIIAGAQKPNIPIPGECRFFRSEMFSGYE